MKHYRVLILLALAAFAFALAGCGSTETPALPTPDQAATIEAVSTQAAATIVAGLTANAPAATETPMPTATEEAAPELPTAEPQPTETLAPPTFTLVPPTATFAPIVATSTPMPTVTPTSTGYECSIVEVAPSSSSTLKASSEFDAVWKIKNTGTKSWPAASGDFKFVSGTKMQTYGDLFDLKNDVKPNETYTFIVDMETPGNAGKFTATWILADGPVTYCTLNLTVNVEE
jgi:hypothetical protein